MTEETTDKPLTIGLVIDDSLDSTDGVQQHVLTLGRWLTGKGHTVHYLTSTTKRTDVPRIHSLAKNLRLKFNGNRLGIPLPASSEPIKELFDTVEFDVLHIHMPYSPFMAGRVIAHAPRTTTIVGTFHILPWSWLTKYGTKVLGWIQRKQLQRFKQVIAVSSPAAAFAREALQVSPIVIGNPVRVLGYENAHKAEMERAQQHPAEDAPVRIFFLGRLVERKGISELLAACRRLVDITDTPFEIVVGGKGPLYDELMTYIATHGLDKITSFIGYVAEDDKAELLAQSDIVALPSTGGESFGISVVEALAACRGVVIAGDNPGYRTVMDSLEDQLIDARDTEAFALMLKRYVENRDERTAASKRQVEQARRFDVDYIGRKVIEVYTR
ncbi:glycosyltransferase family 4 protein [Timonella sp. A28]|uniref:glycosyltransferase family 4 protein n=1 Tax=Timonella sp. A28 TaxID=3442640 RepID=UPI003EBAFC8F